MNAAATPEMYFVSDVNGTVYGVNLTTHAIQWSFMYDNLDQFLAVPNVDVLLVITDNAVWAMKGTTGQLMWANNTIEVAASESNSNNVMLDQASGTFMYLALNQQTFNEQVCAADYMSGRVLWCNGLGSSMPVATVPGHGVISGQDTNFNSVVCSLSLRTGATDWCRYAQGVLAATTHAVLLSNTSSNASAPYSTGQIDLVHPVNGSTITVVHNVPQLVNEMSAALTNDTLAFTDLMNGVWGFNLAADRQVWSFQPVNLLNDVEWAPAQGVVITQVNQDGIYNQLFNLTGLRIDDGKTAWEINFPPTDADSTFFVFGEMLYIPNLEGYTIWSVANGTLVGRDEHNPIDFMSGTAVSPAPWTIIGTTAAGLISYVTCA